MARLKLLEMTSTTREYLHIPVTGTWLLSMPVEIAVVPYGTKPTSSDWKEASWDGTGARLLIGAGTDVPLAVGNYAAWWRVTADPERPDRKAGIVRIT